jgi:hypothetical protein
MYIGKMELPENAVCLLQMENGNSKLPPKGNGKQKFDFLGGKRSMVIEDCCFSKLAIYDDLPQNSIESCPDFRG